MHTFSKYSFPSLLYYRYYYRTTTYSELDNHHATEIIEDRKGRDGHIGDHESFARVGRTDRGAEGQVKSRGEEREIHRGRKERVERKIGGRSTSERGDEENERYFNRTVERTSEEDGRESESFRSHERSDDEFERQQR